MSVQFRMPALSRNVERICLECFKPHRSDRYANYCSQACTSLSIWKTLPRFMQDCDVESRRAGKTSSILVGIKAKAA